MGAMLNAIWIGFFLTAFAAALFQFMFEGRSDIFGLLMKTAFDDAKTAFEIALKCKELANILAEPYSSADFLHGPIAMVDEGFPVNLISMGATFKDELNSLVKNLHACGARLITIGDAPLEGHISGSDQFIRVPGGLPEWLSPIAAVIPGQLLAYYLAKGRGVDPDAPRAIHKVTLTK